MAFRARQKYRSAGYEVPVMYEEKTLESGMVVTQEVDLTKEKLPAAELFNLEDQIKAGVMLDEVNSKIMKGSKVDVAKVVNSFVDDTAVSESESKVEEK